MPPAEKIIHNYRGNGNEVIEMGGNWDEKSVPVRL